jgi:hypothetical protein
MTTINGRKVVLTINGVEYVCVPQDNANGLDGMGVSKTVTVEFTRQETLTPEMKEAHRRYLAGEISDDDI